MSGLSTYAVAVASVTASKIELDKAVRDLRVASGAMEDAEDETLAAYDHYFTSCRETFCNSIETLCYLALVHTVIHPRNFKNQWEAFIRPLAVHMPELAAKDFVAQAIAEWDLMDAEAEEAATIDRERLERDRRESENPKQ